LAAKQAASHLASQVFAEKIPRASSMDDLMPLTPRAEPHSHISRFRGTAQYPTILAATTVIKGKAGGSDTKLGRSEEKLQTRVVQGLGIEQEASEIKVAAKVVRDAVLEASGGLH
jgi:hypothetical protein